MALDEEEPAEDGGETTTTPSPLRLHGDDGKKARRKQSEQERPPLSRRRSALKDTGKPHGKEADTNPLDAMFSFDEDAGGPDAEERISQLRARLEKKKNEGSMGISALLTERVKEETEDAQQRRSRSRRDDKVAEAIKVLVSAKKRKREDDESSFDEDLAGDDILFGDDKDSNLGGKQKRIKKLAQEKPGALLLKGYTLMQEQLGALYGEGGSSRDGQDKILRSAALRYLLTTALPLVDVHKVGDQKLRELRTLATCLDLLVVGKVSSAGDHLMQRFKSLLMSIRDGTDAASRYLELIPNETYPMGTSVEEAGVARQAAYQALKQEALLAKVRG